MRRAVVLSLLLSIVATPAFSYGKGEGTQEVQIDRKVKREFFLSLRSGDFSKAKELIASGKVPVDFRNKFKQTPLYYAADNDDPSFAKFLVEHGANVNARDLFGITPLHEAVIRGSYRVAKFLIEKGADVNAKDNYGYTPLHLAAIYNRARLAKLLIEHGADVNAKDNYGNTPLHYCATTFGTAPVAKVLLQNGGDPNVKNNRGKTPLELANEVKNFPVAKLMTKVIQKRR
jgi:ankyrin repeat protein